MQALKLHRTHKIQEFKEELVFHSGFRQYTASPIYSEDTVRVDKFKYERFMHGDRQLIATIFGPITFPPASLVVFKKTTKGLDLVATGKLHNVDPDRIILKKIIITGLPFKINRNRTIVRHMFHNPEDVKWFKPVHLWTKYGRTGHIKQPLGTHGLFKCFLDNKIAAHDTICMSLYKRIFPLWPVLPDLPKPEEPKEINKIDDNVD